MSTLEEIEYQIREAMTACDWITVARLEPELDALDVPPSPIAPSLAALWYASQGLPVFPLQEGLKIPYPQSKGVHDATTDPDRIRAYWDWRPTSNIGLATGHVVDVIDIDGPEGLGAMARMQSLPEIVGIVSTPRPGGMHLYVAATGKGNRAGIVPHVDYRGLGGYVVAPPSSGPDGKPYRWIRIITMPKPKPRGICEVCGTDMIIIDEGQTTHPGCEAA